MQERHTNREKYFKAQGITTKKYIIPFIQEIINIDHNTAVLEIGCGEGGNLAPFLAMGCRRIVGIDLSKRKIENARKFFNKIKNNERIVFIHDDIYNINPTTLGQFNIILTKDVLEHIPDQKRFL